MPRKKRPRPPRSERYRTLTIRKSDYDTLQTIQANTGWSMLLILHFIIEHHRQKLPTSLTDVGYVRLGNTVIRMDENNNILSITEEPKNDDNPDSITVTNPARYE
jgi:hypothetical protein